MSDVAIRAVNLSKKYRIGGPQASYRTIREAVVNAAAAPARRAAGVLRGNPPSSNGHGEIWALKDVSFEIKRGEVVGVIGANGAGKSTLLKILSRITRPTSGYADIHGRVGSLLEVGTGFHPELTGRENVYLSGAVMGMKRGEIARKFDEMVDFAGVEKFVDTPVKHFSSGMYLRLAFAVAAHLDPEILLVDEVLAVGDAEFQKKCLGKMGEVADEGRTVLFVSHNMAAVENLCQRGMLLDQGSLKFQGSQKDTIYRYIEMMKSGTRTLGNLRARGSNGQVRITDITFKENGRKFDNKVRSGEDLEVCFHYETSVDYIGTDVRIGFTIRNIYGTPIFAQQSRVKNVSFYDCPPTGTFVCHIPKLPLPSGTYKIDFTVKVGNVVVDKLDNAQELQVLEGDFFGTGRAFDAKLGLCLVDANWRFESEDSNG